MSNILKWILQLKISLHLKMMNLFAILTFVITPDATISSGCNRVFSSTVITGAQCVHSFE